MTTFLAAFFLASSSPQKEFSRTKMAIGVFYSQVFLKKFNAPMSRFRGPPILQNFNPGKMSKTKTNKPKKPQGFARFWEACVTEWLTPRTLDLEVRGSSLAHRVVSLTINLTPLSFSSPRCTNGYRQHTAEGGGRGEGGGGRGGGNPALH